VATRTGSGGPAHAGGMFRRLKGVSWALFDQCVVSSANFLTIYLFARHLGTASFGAFMLAQTGLLLLTSMQNALVIQPHNVLAAGLAQADYRQFTGALVVMQGVSCTAICVLVAMAGMFVTHFGVPSTGSVLIALAIAAAPWMGQEFVRRVLYTRGESRMAAINDIVSYGLQLFGAYILARFWSDQATPQAALFVLGGSSLAGVLMGVWQLRGHVSFSHGSPGAFLRTWREVWNFGKWLTGQNLLVWFGAQGHSWIVGLLLGVEQVGLYRAATHLANVMNPLRQTAYSYLPSRGSLAYQDGGCAGLSRWVRSVWWTFLAALLPICIVLVGFPRWVLHAAYGERYAGADLALILALSTVAQCITFLKFPFDLGLLALRATRSIFYVYLIPVILLFTSGVGFIYFMGILGVPLSGIIINSALLVATVIAYVKREKHGTAGDLA
jgi:O-antigen/teichoic acid export membrane protein